MKRLDGDPLQFFREDFPFDGPAQIAVKIRHKCTGARPGYDNALLLQLTVGFCDRVGIDSELSG